MFSNITAAQICGFLFLFILLTSALRQALAASAIDTADVPSLCDVKGCGTKKGIELRDTF